MSLRKTVENLIVGTILTASSVAVAEAKPVQEEGDLVKLKLSALIESLDRAQEDTVITEAALVLSSRREFCKAVEDWTTNYMDRSAYQSGKSVISDENLIKFIPPSVGRGEFFENVVVGLITKGCLTPEERRAYFEEYKVRVLRYYLNEVEWALGEIDRNKAAYVREERGAVETVETAQEYARTLEAFYEQGKDVNYEDIFSDESKEVAMDFTKGSHYRNVVTFIKSLESKKGNEKLTMVSEKMDTMWELYNHESTPEGEKQDLLKGYLLLQDYQVKLMHDVIPNPGGVASQTIDVEGTAIGETEFSTVMKNDSSRTFMVPELDLDKELQSSRILVADGDNKWLRMAELAYFTYAVNDFLEGMAANGYNSTIVDWELSLDYAKEQFANLPTEDDVSREYRDKYTSYRGIDGDWARFMKSYVPAHLMEYPELPAAAHEQNGYDFATLYDRYPFCDYHTPKMQYDWCLVSIGGLKDNTDHLVEAYSPVPGLRPARLHDLGGTTTDVPQMLLRKIAREHVADAIERNAK